MARRSFISIFRKLLLLALVLTVVAVLGLFLFGRAGRQRERPLDEGETRARQGTTLIGEDFDYTFTEREKPIFRIRGESIRADEKGIVYLDGVGLTIYDQEGRPYHVESRRATFRRETNEGQLQGEVFLKGPEGLELRTARLDLRRKGRLIVAPKEPVEIRYGGKYVVTSAKLQVDIEQETYVLAGGVQVNTLPGATATPGSLKSQRLVYERKKRWLRVEGNAALRHGADRLNAERLAAKLSEDEGSLTFIRALQGVTGQTRGTLAALGSEPAASQPATTNFSGRDLAVVLQPEGNEVRRVELEAANKGKAVIESTGGGITRTMRAYRFEGLLENGVLDTAEAVGGIEIREVVRGAQGGTRQAESQRASVELRAGQLVTADLVGNVVYRDGEMTATGNRGTLDLEAGRGDFVGSPVDIVSPRGRVRAPRVVYNTDQKIIQARGGVRAVLEKASETALSGTPLGEGEGPVTVESQEAFWRQAPTSSFLFRGDVRAWRGKNLLLAPELRGDKDQNILTATGGVKTRWIPDSTPSAAPGRPAARPPAKPAAPGTGNQAPIEVAANEMVYKDGSGQLTYTGNVRVEQEARTLTCQNLQVELEQTQADEREVETMTCTGDTKLNDPATGRRIEGQKAVYHVAERQMEMFGEPVTMRDRDGNVVRGRRLFYFMDDGKVEIKGGGEGVQPAPAASAGGTQ